MQQNGVALAIQHYFDLGNLTKCSSLITLPNHIHRFFIGSLESTFSFRIQEEREILGFPVEQTFSILCPEGQVANASFYASTTFFPIPAMILAFRISLVP